MGCSALLTFLLLVLINSFIFLDNVEVAFLMTVKKEDILSFYKVRKENHFFKHFPFQFTTF